jgi:sulfur carrier protein
MNIQFNGQWMRVEGQTVYDVLASHGLEAKPVVVEVSGEILDPSQWRTTRLSEGMILEVVHFVGGG